MASATEQTGHKVLIAERGEAAARVARTCKRLDLQSVALQATNEQQAVHLEACDEVYTLDIANRPATGQEVVQAALAVGADVVHPGYASPARHLEIARACVDGGLGWLGGSVETLAALGDRSGARVLADRAEVRGVPSYRAPISDADTARQAAAGVGYPVLFKSIQPSSGVVPQVAGNEDAVDEAYTRCRNASEHWTGDARVTVERRFDRPRLLEVTLAGDAHGGIAAIGDRERSLWMDGCVLLDESPSSSLTTRRDGEAIRGSIFDSAIRVAREAQLADVASASFLFDVDGRTWFLGLEPGLPVSHSLNEIITGLDLVELQLRIAAGEAIADELQRLEGSGHAFCARVRARDPEGRISVLRWPASPQGTVRVDPCVMLGTEVDSMPDPLLLKITTYAPIRHAALLTLDRFLAAAAVEPLTTDIPLLRRALGHEAFQAGQYDTTFADRIARGAA